MSQSKKSKRRSNTDTMELVKLGPTITVVPQARAFLVMVRTSANGGFSCNVPRAEAKAAFKKLVRA